MHIKIYICLNDYVCPTFFFFLNSNGIIWLELCVFFTTHSRTLINTCQQQSCVFNGQKTLWPLSSRALHLLSEMTPKKFFSNQLLVLAVRVVGFKTPSVCNAVCLADALEGKNCNVTWNVRTRTSSVNMLLFLQFCKFLVKQSGNSFASRWY